MPSGGSADMINGDFTVEGSATSSHLICMIDYCTCTSYMYFLYNIPKHSVAIAESELCLYIIARERY